ncbi:aryl-sulfate sulfohydrolase [Haloferula helveola]|uniref:Aryl-sulfate sulfohydrolase n=1 Tax=Haloferula helveola TaxID=490095 RepID=A0ABN6H6Y6_9BACT|nr:aryl-sulfate sulfohydrolase [Haloferula helveola]
MTVVKYLLLATALVLPCLAKPNIILFYADDLGWTDLGCQGSDYYESPRIDALAKEGMTFSQAYAGAANCAPSRACLITGLYTPRHGVFTVGKSDRGKSKDRKLIPIENRTVLDPKFPALPQALQKAGYATCVAGKWHLSKDPKPYGFDHNIGACDWGHPKSYFSPYKSPVLKDGPKGEHLPARLAKDVSDWIRTRKDDPFFVYFPFYSVHTPIEAESEVTARYKSKTAGTHHDNPKYAAMIDAMDRAVGTVLDTLAELGLEDDTIVVFTSDNGPHAGFSTADPLSGSKGMYLEGGIREPFIVRWPGKTKAGSRCDIPVHQVDLFPTLVKAAGGELPELLDGVDFGPLAAGGAIGSRNLFWHFPGYLEAYGPVHGDQSKHFRTTPCSVIRKGDWKLIEYFEDGSLRLFNLADDPSEKQDRLQSDPEKAEELLGELKAWRKETDAPVPTRPNPDYKG